MAAEKIPPAELHYMLSHPGENHSTQVIVSTAVCVPIAVVCVTLRFLSRWVGHSKVGLDDWLVVAGLVFSMAFSFTMLSMTQWGFGHHILFIAKENFVKLGRAGFSALVILPIASYLVKLSILFLLWRIFPLHRFKIILQVVGAFITALALAHFLATLLECLPVGTQFGPKPHKCVNLIALYTATSAINAFCDFVILSLPLPIIFRLKQPLGRKLHTFGIFSVGALACAASVIRTVYGGVDHSTDETFGDALTAAWAIVEINTSVICACLPCLGPIIRRIREGKQDRSRPYIFGSASNTINSSARTESFSDSKNSAVVGSDDWALYNDDHMPLPTAGGIKESVMVNEAREPFTDQSLSTSGAQRA